MVAQHKELSQDKIMKVAQKYFRDLLREGNADLYRALHSDDKDNELHVISRRLEREVTDARDKLSQGLEEDGLPDDHKANSYVQKLNSGSIDPKGMTADILYRYFLRADIARAHVILAKMEHNFAGTNPTDPVFAGILDDTHSLTREQLNRMRPTNTPLIEVYDKYMEAQGYDNYKTKMDYQRVLGWFMEMMGNKKPISHIATQDVSAFSAALHKLPKSYSQHKKYEGKGFSEVVAMGLPKSECLAPKTAYKYLGLLKTFLGWAEDNGYILSMPGKGVKIKVKKEAMCLPFTQGELKACFKTPLWIGCESIKKRYKPGEYIDRDAYYWIPLLAVYTGMREGEIIQLRHSDIIQSSGVWYIRVSDDDDKTVKTHNAIRNIPIHKVLVDFGFLEFLAERKTMAKQEPRIFYEVKIALHKDGSADVSNNYSKSFGRYLNHVKLKKPKIRFHSFRHSFADALDTAGVPTPHKNYMMGHSSNHVSEGYGQGPALKALSESINKIKYDFEKTCLHLYPNKKKG